MTKTMYKQIVGILLVILISSSIVVIYLSIKNGDPTKLDKPYTEKELIEGINDYKYMAISNKKLGQIYYIEFLNLIRNDSKKAYNKLTKDTKEGKFKSYNDFKKYIKNTKFSSIIKKVEEEENKFNYTYKVLDAKNNSISFITKAVMDYEASI